MSGTLLFINKKKQNNDNFTIKIEQLKNYTKKLFDEYFNFIIFRKLNRNSFLIEFRQDRREKFCIDQQGNWLAYEGTVFALDETKYYNAEDLLNLYKNYGEDFTNKLDGHFVIKIYDATQDSYLIISDFIKYKTNFFAENESFLLFTPFLLTTRIIKKPELDQHAFNEFMWRYSILSERSMFKGVTRLAPAAIYKIQHGKITTKTYWEWPHYYTKLSFADSVDKMVESIKESARLIQHSFGKPCLDMTMGQDSRTIISAFTNQNLPFVTSTYGKSEFFEVQAVKEMAKRHNIENHNIQLTQNYMENLWNYFEKAVLLGSCELPGYLLGRILFMKNEQLKLGNALINGSDGQFYKNGLWIEMYTFNFYLEPKKVNINLFLKLRALSRNYFDKIFEPNFVEIKNDSSHYFENIIKNTINDHIDSPVSIQMDKFSLYRWTNFLNATNSTGCLFSDSLSPLLMRRNLELALQIPVRWKFNSSRFQRAVVYKLNPELAREKTDMGGINMVPKNIFTYIPFWFRYSFFQSKRLRNKIKTILGIHVYTELQEAWDYLPIYKLLFQDKNFQKNLIYENMYLSEIVKKDEWKNLLSKFQDKDFQTLNNYEYLFKIISVEYFMKKANEIGDLN